MIEFGTLKLNDTFTFDSTEFVVIGPCNGWGFGQAMSASGRMVVFNSVDMVIV